ncbi:MAG: oligosaccharide flippase family protein [Bdellovibrionales bacterium]
MRALVASLYRHQFFTLSSGIVAANLLSLVSMPLLTRLYSSEDFGFFAVYYSIANIVGLFSTFRFEIAIPIASNDAESSDISTVALFTVMVVVVLAGLFLFAFAAKSEMGSLIYPKGGWVAVVISSFCVGAIQIGTQRLIRTGRLRFISARHIAEKTGFVVFALLMAVWDKKIPGGLIWSQTAAFAVGLIILLRGSPWKIKWSFRRILSVARKYSDFPRKNSLSTLLQILTLQLPAPVYSAFFGAEQVGYLNLAQRLVEAPNTLITGSISAIFYRRILQAPRVQFRRIFLRTMGWYALLITPPLLLSGIYASPLITWLFGSEWQPAAVFFVALLPIAFSRLIYMVQQSYLMVIRDLGLDLKISATLFLLQFSGLGAGLLISDSLATVVQMSSWLLATAYLIGVKLIYDRIRGALPLGPAMN